jgi:hypothetical protein
LSSILFLDRTVSVMHGLTGFYDRSNSIRSNGAFNDHGADQASRRCPVGRFPFLTPSMRRLSRLARASPLFVVEAGPVNSLDGRLGLLTIRKCRYCQCGDSRFHRN